jgi:predicted small lipoprotein YifL
VSRRLRLATAALVLASIGGCGQKGALYLPDATPQAVKTTPAAPTPDQAPARRTTPTDPEPATAQ